MVENVGLTGVQRERHFGAAFHAELKHRGLDVLRVVAVSQKTVSPKVRDGDALLFDSPREGATRQPLDIETVKKMNPSRPFYIAGGLNAANVGVYLKALRPDGVDLSSGVESRPGIKCEHALKDFFKALHRAGDAL